MTDDPYAPRKGKSPCGDYPAWVDQLVEFKSDGGPLSYDLVRAEPLLVALDYHVKDVIDHEIREDVRDFITYLVDHDPEMIEKYKAFQVRRKLLRDV
jgi:hypothetical protein